jgi:hypothetical protein
MNAETEFLVRVIEEYQAPYPDPIQAKADDEVVVDLSRKTDIVGWVWCANSAGKSGWVPNVYVEINDNQGRLLKDYNAIELTIHVGDVLTVYKEESSFYWASNQAGDQGWVPIKNVEAMEAKV